MNTRGRTAMQQILAAMDEVGSVPVSPTSHPRLGLDSVATIGSTARLRQVDPAPPSSPHLRSDEAPDPSPSPPEAPGTAAGAFRHPGSHPAPAGASSAAHEALLAPASTGSSAALWEWLGVRLPAFLWGSTISCALLLGVQGVTQLEVDLSVQTVGYVMEGYQVEDTHDVSLLPSAPLPVASVPTEPISVPFRSDLIPFSHDEAVALIADHLAKQLPEQNEQTDTTHADRPEQHPAAAAPAAPSGSLDPAADTGNSPGAGCGIDLYCPEPTGPAGE